MTQHRGNNAEVNGLRLCYEIHGTGEPLILLHGGVGASHAVPRRAHAGGRVMATIGIK